MDFFHQVRGSCNDSFSQFWKCVDTEGGGEVNFKKWTNKSTEKRETRRNETFFFRSDVALNKQHLKIAQRQKWI